MSEFFRSRDLTQFVLPGESLPRFARAEIPLASGVPFSIIHLANTDETLRLDFDKQAFLGELDESLQKAAVPLSQYLRGLAAKPLRVFISYSWDSAEHMDQVLRLAQRLRGDGIDAWLDRFVPAPKEGWPLWVQNQLDEAQFVIAIASEKYSEGFVKEWPTAADESVRAMIARLEFEALSRSREFLPVVFSTSDVQFIPHPLRSYPHYHPNTEAGYTALVRRITGGSGVSAGSTAIVPVYNHAASHSNLPQLPYGFFGRHDELEIIASALELRTRTWGALIDGPGGIGKTALAIRAAEQSPPGQFARIIFLSAKSRELYAEGEHPLHNFVIPGYTDMLNALAEQLGRPELARTKEKQRALQVQRALEGQRALLVLDNLESLPASDRENLFDFLSCLPEGCKAIVTSRRRTDIDARTIRLDRLDGANALKIMSHLARSNPVLARSTEPERIAVCEAVDCNPLLIRWVAGQLGRGKCDTIADALDFLMHAPRGNDPFEYIFGDLADSFSSEETKTLAALSHFTVPAPVRLIADVADLPFAAVEHCVENLADRALVAAGDAERKTFHLMPQVGHFLRTKRSEAVNEIGDRLIERANTLIDENGFLRHERFPVLEEQWPVIIAALPLLLAGENESLQNACDGLQAFLDYSGHWDEWLSISERAEERAVRAGDFNNAGWRAYQASYAHFLRREAADVLKCARRAEDHWKQAGAGAREQAVAVQLRGLGFQVAGDYASAIASFQKGVEFWRQVQDEDRSLATALNDLSDVKRHAGDMNGAEENLIEALEIARREEYQDLIASFTGNFATFALVRRQWHLAEERAREALLLSENVKRVELIATNCSSLAEALIQQGKKPEAMSYARRAVEILSALRSRNLDRAREVLVRCET